MYRRWKILIALTIALISGVVIRLRGKTSPKIQEDFTNKPTYEAPFSNPNAYLEDPPIIPEAYIVHLAPGHGIEKHSSAIKRDLTPHIFDRSTPTDPKSRSAKTTYTGQSISDSLLAAIRADPQVTLVEYATNTPPEGITKPVGYYQAPLRGCDGPRGEIVPGSFQILLAPDYSLREHSSVIGRDIEALIVDKYNFHTNKWVFSAKPVGRDLLRAIRSDRGVELVVCESTKKRQTEGDLRPKEL